MQSLNGQLSFKIPEAKHSAPRTHRESLIEEIRAAINKERVGTKYKPMTHMGIKLKVKHLSDFDLSWHMQECKKANSFSRCFFGRLKVEIRAEERSANE